MIICVEYAFDQHVMHRKLRIGFFGDVDPEAVAWNSLLKVLAVQVNGVALERDTQESDQANKLAIEFFWRRDQLNDADILGACRPP